MSYTVLARKWRPKNFQELVGQDHVMQALSNALTQNRLHHAYLFTGTRGVGKTTIARIFAKSLNCIDGITATPCGVCEHCQAIDQGRFIDLIEVDAASKTKVDDTREILDNVQFAPTQGRYKVYLIDEVHMLSKSSFNALLKTLEEPPEHVKFLLATTDPHKLPITVLSRCLQFNLMRLSQVQISEHLAYVLTQEGLGFETSALNLIAHSADGSLRDALSLLDQAIAYGAGQIAFEGVQTMLGLVDQQFGQAILQALATQEGEALKQTMMELSAMGVDYAALLAQLIEMLHQLSYRQVLGESYADSTFSQEVMGQLAEQLAPERVQMLYQIALLARQDMQLAPTMQIGFEMALMRMLAFMPVQAQERADVKQASVAQPDVSEQEASLRDMDVSEALTQMSPARALLNKTKAAKPAHTSEPVKPLEAAQPATQMSSATNAGQRMEQMSERMASIVGKSQAAPANESEPPVKPVSVTETPIEPNTAMASPTSQIMAQMKSGISSRPEEVLIAPALEDVPPWEEALPQVAPMQSTDEVANYPIERSFEQVIEPPVTQLMPESMSVEDHSNLLLQWMRWMEQANLQAMMREVARHCVPLRVEGQVLYFSIDSGQNFAHQSAAQQQLMEAMQVVSGYDFQQVDAYANMGMTPAQYEAQQVQMRQAQAEQSIAQDPWVQQLQNSLGMSIVSNSIKPILN